MKSRYKFTIRYEDKNFNLQHHLLISELREISNSFMKLYELVVHIKR